MNVAITPFLYVSPHFSFLNRNIMPISNKTTEANQPKLENHSFTRKTSSTQNYESKFSHFLFFPETYHLVDQTDSHRTG